MCIYKLPKLIDINAKSRLIRNRESLLILSRCIELEHPEVIEGFKGKCAILTVCPEEEHINQVGFKLAGILARDNYKEVIVLSVDGSMHCVQLHFMVEEIFKIMSLDSKVKRRHLVLTKGEVIEVSKDCIKNARFLSKVDKLLKMRS